MKLQFLITKKIQDFRSLIFKLERKLNDGTYHQLSHRKRNAYLKRLRRLYRMVQESLTLPQFKQILASSAFMLALASATQAQTFAPPVEVTNGLAKNTAQLIHFADIDNDGDDDAFLVYGNGYQGRLIGFQRNIGTRQEPIFDDLVLNPFNISVDFIPIQVELGDTDGDGDLDLLINSYDLSTYETPVFFIENTGTASSPNFSSAAVVNPFNILPSERMIASDLADIDGDGDLDLLSSNYDYDNYASGLLFQQNLTTATTNPRFDTPVINPFGLNNQAIEINTLDLKDIDLDGDLDLLYGGYGLDDELPTLYYFENTGTATNATFGAPQENPFNFALPANASLFFPAFSDIDGDGDLDIVGSVTDYDTYETTVFFWENLLDPSSTTSVATAKRMKVFPTVASDKVNWEVNAAEDLGASLLQMVNQHGQVISNQEIRIQAGVNSGQLPLHNLTKGMYHLRMVNAKGKTTEMHPIIVK